jgi:(E)-4-hydroxy-3-methylbut-2-enyl-diphosphate synthase
LPATSSDSEQKSVRNPTRPVRIGTLTIGAGHPVAVQSMTATKTSDVAATVAQIRQFESVEADLVRIAVDSAADANALPAIRAETRANLSIDLQENYRLAARVAPHVDKIRYNPGHLYHHERGKSVEEKVKFIANVAGEHDVALRVGVNCGSVDPAFAEQFGDDDLGAMVASALEHCEMLDRVGFTRYAVSLKDSDPNKVVEGYKRCAKARPDVPLHLGVTEAGLPPDGIVKTRVAFEQLLSRGIGDTIRVSLTLPNDRKHEEITVGRKILDDISAGRFRSVPFFETTGLNIISCPSCSRVENDAFVELAQNVKEMTRYAAEHRVTIAVMGCRVNGPGETDDADLGLWCGPHFVNLKKGPAELGAFRYDEILGKLRGELDKLIVARATTG